jgi:hypothetical protein
MVNTAHGQTFLDTDTGEMLVIDSFHFGNFHSLPKDVRKVYYSNHTTRYIPLKIIDVRYDTTLEDTLDYPGIKIKVAFTNDLSKIYRLNLMKVISDY